MKSKAIILSTFEQYTLRFVGGRYKAGCRNFSREKAIAHWRERSKFVQVRTCGAGCKECDEIVRRQPISTRAKRFLRAIRRFKEPRLVAKKQVKHAK